jgi:hypothetical protein
MANLGTYRISTINDLKLLRNNAGTIVEVDLSMANSADFKTDMTTITYEGDGTQTKKYFSTAFDMEIEADDFDLLALELIFSKVAVTASLPVGVAKRSYWGANADSSGIVCGIKAACAAEEVATGLNKTLWIVAPKGTLSPPNPPALKNIAKAGVKLTFSARKTLTDIAAVALPGVPADGCFWYADELT